MITHGNNIKIFTCNAHPELAKGIAAHLGSNLSNSKVYSFSDGEIAVDIPETVRGADVFVVQPTSFPVNHNLMELLIIIDAFKRASAGRITAVIPYFGYARQDRKAKARDPISAKLVADLIDVAGADRVLTMDLHSSQIQGFFNVPVDNLVGMPILAPYFEEKFKNAKEDLVIVSPDLGSVKRARSLSNILHVPIAIVDKVRPKANVAEVMNIIGDINGKTALLIDDMIDTAGTITEGAKALMKRGAKEVYACCTHGVLSGPAIERIKESPITELVMLDTIPLPEEKRIDKIKVLPVAEVFAHAIKIIYEDKSISTLFDK